MLEACPKVDVLSTTIPLVPPATFVGTATATDKAAAAAAVGGHAGSPVTFIDMRQPVPPELRHEPAGIGFPADACWPKLKKIQSLATPAAAPLGLKNSVTGEHAWMLAATRLISGALKAVNVPPASNMS